MLLELKNIVTYAQDRRLLEIDSLKIHQGEKIGLVGRNGAGKSTLLAILADESQPDEGYVHRNCPVAYIPQLDHTVPGGGQPDPAVAGELSVSRQYAPFMSGGELARYKIAVALGEDRPLLLADEPAANLDLDGREILQAKLRAFPGALVLVSHDRRLLDTVCTTIWELENGRLTVYPGNYAACLAQKENVRKRQRRDYEQYVQKKKCLQSAIADRAARSVSTRKTPSRMGNSEARLHKMGNQKAKATLDKAVKALETRLEKLTVPEKPWESTPASFAFENTGGLYSKIVVRGDGITKRFGGRVIFEDAAFSLANGQKAALCGGNGCGKSTLLNMIFRGESSVWVSPNARLGYFAQEMDDLELEATILANVMAGSVHNEGDVRSLLARLLFRREDVFKPVRVLSGGERARVSLARIIAGGANLLLLDEPTNYLDLSSMEALEEVLAEYRGTMLFVSHDRQLIDRIATSLIIIDSGKLRLFPGNYRQYLEHEDERNRAAATESRMVLEYRLSAILARLSVTGDKEEAARLEKEYRELLPMMKA
ncbi:ribosomal protection-like ABC-F family protein [Anaeroselena agilis]|uniref:ABC-F type ribosomal protection protein n=1 Tax=Anaeroselena agilis TaxID=3063788 RepID=A0ABU3NY28_9FIRM|nr:ABC-F type ribosomal protection protein [Selenomonadales bacterium 4137-cl]